MTFLLARGQVFQLPDAHTLPEHGFVPQIQKTGFLPGCPHPAVGK